MKRRDNRRQLTLDWTAAVSTEVAKPAAAEPASAAPAKTGEVPAATTEQMSPIQILPWDFQTTFPAVLPDAVEAGAIDEDGCLPENLAALHAEHAAEMLMALQELDAVHDARRRGVDPATGKVPKSAAKRRVLSATLDHEIQRIERWWQTLLSTYEAAFGSEAGEAFGKFVRARHAGIEVIADPKLAPLPSPRPNRTMPQPAAARQSVQAGVFGQDENGPVDPSEDEIFDITKNHAQAVTELMELFQAAGRSEDREAAVREIKVAQKKYAEDFGEAAAEQLVDYCYLQVVLNQAEPLRYRGDR